MECWKRETDRKNLIHNKEGTLGPCTSTALNTVTTVLYNPLYLEKEAPNRCKAGLRHYSLCSDSMLASLERPAFNRMVLFLIPRWASSATAINYSSTQVYQSCLCDSGYCNSVLPKYRHFMKVWPEKKPALELYRLSYKCLLCHNYIKNPNGPLIPVGCFSLSHTGQLFKLNSRVNLDGVP